MAPAAGGAQVDVSRWAKQAFWCSCRDPTARAAHGRGKSEVGLHANSGRPRESGAPGRAIDDRAYLEGPRSATSAEATDVVADVSASTLGSDRRSRFLFD